MSEIEKMYENCNIKPKQKGYCDWDSDCPYPDIINNGCGDECSYWKYEDEAKYPPFTAKKQLLLLQLLARIESADYFQFFFYEIKQEWVFRLNMLTELSCEPAYIYESRNKNFDECIAGLLNLIWQDLTEEKQQVKGILE